MYIFGHAGRGHSRRTQRPAILVGDGTALIPLTQGQCAIVDAEDVELLLRHKWHATRKKEHDTWYAIGTLIEAGSRHRRSERMHRVVLNAGPGTRVDHANGNGLDNRKENLRFATPSQSRANTRSPRGKAPGYRGVLRQSGIAWSAHISIKGRKLRLGSFCTAEAAARAYDDAAKRLFGEFARLNFPDHQ